MEAQQKLLAEHFKKLGGEVEFQRFQVPHPLDNSPVAMANIIVHWQPEKKSASFYVPITILCLFR